MHKLCTYKFIAGPKKGTECGRYIRGIDDELCYAHKKFRKAPPASPVQEQSQTIADPIPVVPDPEPVVEKPIEKSIPVKKAIPLAKEKTAPKPVVPVQPKID